MIPDKSHTERFGPSLLRYLSAAVVVVILAFAGIRAEAAIKQKGFISPEEAVKACVSAMKAGDDKQLLLIFGTGAKELIASGDTVSDKHMKERFIASYDLKNSLVKEGEKMVLIIGEKDWPFPIPLVKKGDKWFFDTKSGREEILNRRVGANELHTVQTLLAIVDAQRDYAMRDRDGDKLPEYAQKLRSDPGKRNGLYWETKEGEKPSPLGEMVATARAEGYTDEGMKDKRTPFHGYFFRMLTKQGEHASGGALDYAAKDNLIGGFAVLAYPAIYGNSGIMTLMVSHDGVVYEKDLGKNTAKTAKAMKAYDPGPGWKRVESGPKK